MRILAVSDIHVDYDENFKWCKNISASDYKNDILILAGDVTDSMPLFEKTLTGLRKRFFEVMFIPGNHDLWIRRSPVEDSLEKLRLVEDVAGQCGVRMTPLHLRKVSIIPLFGWYDYSFGLPFPETLEIWTDFTACRWPQGLDEKAVTQYFIKMNEQYINEKDSRDRRKDFMEYGVNRNVISFSHFLPSIDLMPSYITADKRILYPVLGSSLLEHQVRRLGSDIHIYGHSHVNRRVFKDNTLYINNAFGYPYEARITAKELQCIWKS